MKCWCGHIYTRSQISLDLQLVEEVKQELCFTQTQHQQYISYVIILKQLEATLKNVPRFKNLEKSHIHVHFTHTADNEQKQSKPIITKQRFPFEKNNVNY